MYFFYSQGAQYAHIYIYMHVYILFILDRISLFCSEWAQIGATPVHDTWLSYNLYAKAKGTSGKLKHHSVIHGQGTQQQQAVLADELARKMQP